jgi:hypothetical protein
MNFFNIFNLSDNDERMIIEIEEFLKLWIPTYDGHHPDLGKETSATL